MSATKIPRVHPTPPSAPRVKPCFMPGIVLHAPLHSFSKPSLGGRYHYSNLLQLGPGEVPALCGCIKPGSDWAVGFISGLQSLHFAHHTSSLLLVGRARPQRTEGALTLVDFPSGPNTLGRGCPLLSPRRAHTCPTAGRSQETSVAMEQPFHPRPLHQRAQLVVSALHGSLKLPSDQLCCPGLTARGTPNSRETYVVPLFPGDLARLHTSSSWPPVHPAVVRAGHLSHLARWACS